MKSVEPSFFFDTANESFIRDLWRQLSAIVPATAIRGITTNPNALHKVGVHSLDEVKRHIDLLTRLMTELRPDGKAVVYAQQPSSEMRSDELRRWANLLTTVGDGKTAVALKITPFPEALRMVSELRKTIELNVTGVADSATALRAFSYGVRYVSIIVGRMEEIGVNAIDHVDYVQQRMPDSSEIISGSMRTIEGLRWTCQSRTVPTIGERVWQKMIDEDVIEQLPKLWERSEAPVAMAFPPVTVEGQLELSRQFFAQMDELGLQTYRDFISS